MIALLLLIVPLIASLIVLVGPKQRTALFATLLSLPSLALTAWAYCAFTQGDASLFFVDHPWISRPDIRFSLEMDGISLLMIALTSITTPLIAFSAHNRVIQRSRAYFFMILFMQFALVGVFLANDGILYYVFWELTLIPAYFLLLFWGGAERVRITLKFFIYTLAGSLFMMLGFIYLYHLGGGQSLSPAALASLEIPEGSQCWLFAAFMVAFAIKLPIIPFHTWQADTYQVAPTQGTMLLSALMAKMGLFSLYRWLIPAFPEAIETYGHYVILLAVAGVVYGALIAIRQNDMKRLFAFASLSHIGIMAAGILTMRPSGIEGAFVQAFAHGINTVGLLFCADILMNRLGTNDLREMSGIRKSAPQFTTALFILMFATVALPFTNGFIGEVVTLYGIFEYSPWLAAVAVLTIVLGAVYMMRMVRVSVLGEPIKATESFRDLTGSEKWVLYPVILMIFVFGICYQPLFDLTNQAVTNLFDNILIR